MKKLFKATIFAMMCAAIVLVLQPAQAKADTGNKTLTANQDYLDAVNVDGATNSYEFTMPEDGKVTFTMTMVPGQAKTEYSHWAMWVYNSKQEELDSDTYFGNGYTSQEYNFKKGSKFYVKIQEEYKAVGINYTLCAKVERLTDWELEDEKGTPTVLTNKKTMNGVLHKKDDVDLFKYTIPANGPTSFTFDVPDMSINPRSWGWTISFLDNKKNEIYESQEVKGGLVSRTFNFKKGTTLYVKIRSYSSSNTYGASKIPYTITANTIASKEWEIEKNDSFVGATKIASKKVKASLYKHEDMDYFVYKAAGSKTQIKFTSSVNADTVSNEWRVRVFDKNKKLVKDYTTKAGASKTIKTKKGQKYYIVVSSSTNYYSYNNPTVGQVYGLTCKKK